MPPTMTLGGTHGTEYSASGMRYQVSSSPILSTNWAFSLPLYPHSYPQLAREGVTIPGSARASWPPQRGVGKAWIRQPATLLIVDVQRNSCSSMSPAIREWLETLSICWAAFTWPKRPLTQVRRHVTAFRYHHEVVREFKVQR